MAPQPTGQVKAFNLSKANPHTETSVRDKIKKWQVSGGGVLDEVVVIADSDTEVSGQSSSKKSGGTGKSRGSSSSHAKSKSEGQQIVVAEPEKASSSSQVSKRSVKKEEKEDNEMPAPPLEPPKPNIVERKPKANVLDEDVRDAIAPKKRIVSDGHWRRKHIDPNAKPPSPPKSPKKKEQQYAWVRPPLLTRPGEVDTSPEKAGDEEERPMKVYTGKGKTKPIVTQIHTQLSMRPKESVPMPIPTTPVTPRVRRPSRAEPKKSYKSEEESPPKTARSNPVRTSGTPSRQFDSPYMSQDERPRKRLSKSRKTESETFHTAEIPTRKRSKSMGAPVRHETPRRRSVQKSPEAAYESAGEARPRRRRTRTVSHESKSSHEDFSPPSPPRELNNYDDEAEKRRSNFRAEFATFKQPKERRSHRKKSTKRFSYSPEGIERIPAPVQQEPPGDPVPPQRQTSHRIEAWLTETPDPFRETKKAESRRAFSFEKPAKYARTESTLDTETTITETTITDSTITDVTESTYLPRKPVHDRKASRDGRNSDRRTRATSEPSDYLDPEIEVEYSSTTSVHTLKRSGARHGTASPTSGKPRSKPAPSVSSYTESYTETDVTSSIVSSSIDPNDFNKPGEGNKPYSVARRLFPSTGKRLSTIVSVETLATKEPTPSSAPLAPTAEHTTPPASNEIIITAPAAQTDALAPLPDLSSESVVSASRSRTSLKRKLTKHSDLMTVLSMPTSQSRNGSVISARSIRTHRSRLETATLEDLMSELVRDEVKYMRELRTLADGVIPILLKSVLSKSSAADAAGLFGVRPGQSEKEAVGEASRVIHELSVAIQRLKSLHTRIPRENHFSLLIWAKSAQGVYEKYIKTWRLGFRDVVVSLASPDAGTGSTLSGSGSGVSEVKPPKSENAWDQMPRNEDGYIVDSDGERVDVAFLLKRPLVRLKYLTKTIKGINIKKPSEQAGILARKFEDLMEMARNKVDDEKARLEDEAAAGIDATRARDPKSLAPLAGVKIDPWRCVRARDFFDFHLEHSSGQTVDCRVELLVRDDAPGRGNGGDVLVCEVDESGDRWLLFPPVEFKRVSARAGEGAGEIVVLLRGWGSDGSEWEEVFVLMTADEEVRFEWIGWLGTSPVPPGLEEHRRGMARERERKRPTSSHASSSLLSASARSESTAPLKSRTPSPREVEIPIGEVAGEGSKRWSRDVTSPRMATAAASDTSSYLSRSSVSVDSERATLYGKREEYSEVGSYSSYVSSDLRTDVTPPLRPTSSGRDSERRTTPRNLNEAMTMAGAGAEAGSPTLKRARAKRYHSSPTSKRGDQQDGNAKPVTASAHFDIPEMKRSLKKEKSIRKTNHEGGFSVWIPNTSGQEDSDEESDISDDEGSSYLSGRPPLHHRTSSVPSLKLPSVPKMRGGVGSDEERDEKKRKKVGEEFMMSGALVPEPLSLSPKTPPSRYHKVGSRKDPSSAPSKLERDIGHHRRADSAPATPLPVSSAMEEKEKEKEKPPPPPPHRTPSSGQVKFAAPTPQFSPPSTAQVKRRSSSPLKHEYRPSSPSSESEYTEDESEDSLSEYSQDSLTSSDSEDELDELDDRDVGGGDADTYISSVLSAASPVVREREEKARDRPADLYSLPNGTIKPSESASQAPYRSVPPVVAVESKPAKCVASIFTWSDRGQWELLHPEDCSILITPGLIAAYTLSSTVHTSPDSVPEERPLVAQELTPLVPLRRGTALDITIRSPPTPASRLRPGNNIMFRSRSGEECEVLYNLINRARINNPTYIALQNARPPTADGWAAAMERQNSLREQREGGGGRGWFSGVSRSRSYRSKSRAHSTAGNTESSIGTISSVITAMKRFSGSASGSGGFGISRMSFSGGGSDSMGSGGSGSKSPPIFVKDQTLLGGGAGISNAKIRLYVLQSKNKWVDLGSAKLSILPKEEGAPIAAPIMLHTGAEKRIVVAKKKKGMGEGVGEKLLDVTLPEMCFERWARTGIGVSVWVDARGVGGGVADTGGVGEKRVVKYMIQVCLSFCDAFAV